MFGNDVPPGPIGLLFHHLFGKSREKITKQGAVPPAPPLAPPIRERVKSFDGLSDPDYQETESSRKRSNSNLLSLDDAHASGSGAATQTQTQGPPKRAKKTRFTLDAKESRKSTNSGGSKCEVTKADFLCEAVPQTFELSCKPKALGGGGGFGWSKAGGRSVVCLRPGGSVVHCSGPTLNVNVVGSKDGKCGLSIDKFLAEAEEQVFSVECAPYEFSTGSLGWMGHHKSEAMVGGKKLVLQINLNAPIIGSKEANSGVRLPTSSKARAAARRIDWGTIGHARSSEPGDDLTAVKGIGPFIQERLQGIGINTYAQIAAMTPAIEEDVNEAIEYFPGRVRRDEWVSQAQELAAKAEKKRARKGSRKK